MNIINFTEKESLNFGTLYTAHFFFLATCCHAGFKDDKFFMKIQLWQCEEEKVKNLIFNGSKLFIFTATKKPKNTKKTLKIIF